MGSNKTDHVELGKAALNANQIDNEQTNVLNNTEDKEIVENNGSDVLANEGELDVEKVDYTSFSGFTIRDNTIEIIGYVNSMEGPMEVGQKNNNVFKIYVSNGAERLQIIVWNAEISRIQPLIRTNAIVHFDKLYCKFLQRGNFNKGTEDYELIVQSNTEVNVIGIRDCQSNGNAEGKVPLLVELENLWKAPAEEIRIQGYLKSCFGFVKNASRKNEYMSGCMTNGKYKIEVRISGNIEGIDFEKGSHLEIKGVLQRNPTPLYFLVRNKNDMTICSQKKMRVTDMIKGDRLISKN